MGQDLFDDLELLDEGHDAQMRNGPPHRGQASGSTPQTCSMRPDQVRMAEACGLFGEYSSDGFFQGRVGGG